MKNVKVNLHEKGRAARDNCPGEKGHDTDLRSVNQRKKKCSK